MVHHFANVQYHGRWNNGGITSLGKSLFWARRHRASFANPSVGFGSTPRNGNAPPEVGLYPNIGTLCTENAETTQRHCGAFKNGLQRERGCGGPRQIRRYGQRRDIQREGRLGVWSSDKFLETKSWDTCGGPVCWGLGTGRQGKHSGAGGGVSRRIHGSVHDLAVASLRCSVVCGVPGKLPSKA